MALSVKEIEHVKSATKPRKIWDERGLFLLISPTGSRRWYLKYRYLGVEKKLGLGSYPELSLRGARAKRDEMRAIIAEGRDPSRERQLSKLSAKAEAENTFGAIAREFIEKRVGDGIAETTRLKLEWLLSLLQPQLGRLPVTAITAPVLLGVLQDVQRSGRRETARRLRSFAGRVINFAEITGRTQHNPAPALQRALITPTVRHHPAIIEPLELGRLLRALDGYSGYPSTNAALRLSPHLFQRPGEIRAMRWSDVNLDEGR